MPSFRRLMALCLSLATIAGSSALIAPAAADAASARAFGNGTQRYLVALEYREPTPSPNHPLQRALDNSGDNNGQPYNAGPVSTNSSSGSSSGGTYAVIAVAGVGALAILLVVRSRRSANK